MSRKRIVVVTGGGSGIGRATAKRFAEDGDFVVVADINQGSAKAVAAEITAAGGDATHIAVDVADDSSVTALATAVEDTYGATDVLVTSAGVLQNVASIRNMDMNEHDRVWAVNYRGVYACCREFGGRMAEQGHGCIVNISSTSAIRSVPAARLRPRQGGPQPPDRGARLRSRTPRRAGQRGGARLRPLRADAGPHRRRLSRPARDGAPERARAHHPRRARSRTGFTSCARTRHAPSPGYRCPSTAAGCPRVTYIQHPGWPPKDWDPD